MLFVAYIFATPPHMLSSTISARTSSGRIKRLVRAGSFCNSSKSFHIPSVQSISNSRRHYRNAPPCSVPQSCVDPPCRLFDLPEAPISYHKAWDLQHALVEGMKRNSDTPDALILVEHEPVYTLGTASKSEYVLFDAEELKRGQVTSAPGCDSAPLLVRTERGGEVTYHGPGQLVAYPILNLARHKKDLHWYLRALEATVIDMLQRFYGLEAGRKEGLSGVWVGDEKVCAVGLKVSKWITMHGIALNVCTEMDPFERIIPCGIDDHGVSSLHLLVGDKREVSLDEAKVHLVNSFNRTFGPYEMIHTRNTETNMA